MSAVTQWACPTTEPARRRHLQSVPTGPAAAGRSSVARPATTARPIRLTRRARLLLGVVGAAVVCTVVGGSWASLASPGVPAPQQTVTVQPGQTLSQIAHEAYPKLSIDDAVARMQIVNQLNSSQVGAGERLIITR
ncbi:hypothetical protein [Rudaeicoccus suwonensis]|uniref:LysM domain-containing protein n=1 Tax=Rudaeicoccus suwonensis TaxID=657409 RepID=A0A561ECF9_9MICO|nr:hypothetical protein [Rudaeicoccus suwonensis]TWE13292.1 hypothetical protein BKA23_2121 [Rudaeicoccus suwonensis]